MSRPEPTPLRLLNRHFTHCPLCNTGRICATGRDLERWWEREKRGGTSDKLRVPVAASATAEGR